VAPTRARARDGRAFPAPAAVDDPCADRDRGPGHDLGLGLGRGRDHPGVAAPDVAPAARSARSRRTRPAATFPPAAAPALLLARDHRDHDDGGGGGDRPDLRHPRLAEVDRPRLGPRPTSSRTSPCRRADRRPSPGRRRRPPPPAHPRGSASPLWWVRAVDRPRMWSRSAAAQASREVQTADRTRHLACPRASREAPDRSAARARDGATDGAPVGEASAAGGLGRVRPRAEPRSWPCQPAGRTWVAHPAAAIHQIPRPRGRDRDRADADVGDRHPRLQTGPARGPHPDEAPRPSRRSCPTRSRASREYMALSRS